MIAKEYQRLKEEANYKEPQYIKDKPREPEFWVKPPQEVKFPEPIRENLQKPEKPKAKIDLEKAYKVVNKFLYNKDINDENQRKMKLISRKISDRKK